MSLAKRNRLIEMAYKYNVPVIEERWYGDIQYGEHPMPSLFSLDTHGNVVTIDNAFSMFFNGAKIAFILAPEEMVRKVSHHVSGSQTHLNTLEQLMFAEYIKRGYSDFQTRFMTGYYKGKLEIMLSELETLRKSGVTWETPEGGLGVWCRLPENMNDMRLFETLKKKGVLVCPGRLFFPAGGDSASYMRLSFSNVSDQNIKKGILIIKDEIDRQRKKSDVRSDMD